MKDVIVTTIRIPRDTHELLSQVSENRSETVSGFIRRAILKELGSLNYLNDEEMKSLGVKSTEEDNTVEVVS